MRESLNEALTRVRALLLDTDHLVRAIAAGRRRGAEVRLVRAELRPVTLKAGRHLQLTTSDGSRPLVRNVAPGADLASAVDALLAEPFGNWHVETSTRTVQIRVTKRGDAQVHVAAAAGGAAGGGAPPHGPLSGHDRVAEHLIPPDDPLFTVLGANAAKRRQVDAFVRALATTVNPAPSGPVDVVDLGCGNAYLTFAAFRYLSGLGPPVTVTGIDIRADQRDRNTALAEQLGYGDRMRFVAGTILDAPVDRADLVLALHACDTATDEALARAIGWNSRWLLAAPCCHHDVAAQLRRGEPPHPYGVLTRHGILRERFADVLTDSLRATLLRLHGYRAEVVEFVDSEHTPRNLLIRATRTGSPPTPAQQAEYDELTKSWAVTPRLAELIGVTGGQLPPAPAA